MPEKNIAVVDIGTNSFHLAIAKILEGNSFKIIDSQREVLRLGNELGSLQNNISPNELNKAIETLRQFNKLAEQYECRLNAFATNAVREAPNRDYFLNEVKNKTGLEIKVLTGREEAVLIYGGSEKALQLYNKKSLCIDIGGGSTEIISADSGEIKFAESFQLGAVRLTNKFFPSHKLDEKSIKECFRYAEKHFAKSDVLQSKLQHTICAGSSGTIEAAAKFIYFLREGKHPEKINGVTFTFEELQNITTIILSTEQKEDRTKVPGLDPKRADIIPAGIIILHKFFEMFEISRLTISSFSLREGLILSLIKNL